MKTSFVETMLLRLATHGYAIEEGYELDSSPEWDRIDEYLRSDLMNRIRWRSRFRSDCHLLSKRLELPSKDILTLVALSTREAMDIENVSQYANIPEMAVRKAFRKLEKDGYICCHVNIDGPEWGITHLGMTAIVAEVPIEKLEHSIFKKDSKAYLKMVNFVLEQNKMAPLPLPAPQTEEQVTPTVSVDNSLPSNFFQRLVTMVKRCAEDDMPLESLPETVESCLEKEENSIARQGIQTIGYQDFSEEEKVFFLLLCHQFFENGTEPMEWSKVRNPFDRWQDDFGQYQQAAQTLVSKGLAIMPPCDTARDDSDHSSGKRYMLSFDAVTAIFRGMDDILNIGSICRHADVIRACKIEKKELYFNSKMEKEIGRFRILINPDSSGELMARLQKTGRKSLTCLFYGAPGVGKTELARQLAAETGRDIVIADVAKLTGGYVGETEKNVREIFRSFKYLAVIAKCSPILLFNEADGILTKRFSTVTRYVEKSENAVQGIILQELENFEGIFIATTNMEMNLDEAVDRRLLYKLKFEKPSTDIRVRIIRDRIQWLDEKDARSIGTEFELSGGQIDNIASKCIIEQFISGSEPSLDEIREFCKEEIELGKQRSGGERNPIGFSYNGRLKKE